MNKMLPLLALAFFMLACASAQDYGTVIRTSQTQHTITSKSDSESGALSKALKASKLACKEAGYKSGAYIVNSQEAKYTGMFGSGAQQKTVSTVLGVASSIFDKPANKGVSVSGVKHDLTDDTHEVKLVITCQQ
ncbi:hypothetical protein AAIR98_000515 [Elusimicrobium simillimum]|uniref:hypothetical protein n=1 Tax=Elusimicrobium simillimum TaxID=3143438 RepID=UPI003C6F8054